MALYIKVIRYAKTINFKILLQNNKDSKIYVPYMNVVYSAQQSPSSTTAINFSVR